MHKTKFLFVGSILCASVLAAANSQADDNTDTYNSSFGVHFSKKSAHYLNSISSVNASS